MVKKIIDVTKNKVTLDFMNYATKPKFKYKRVKIIWQDIVTGHIRLEDVEKLITTPLEDKLDI